jgi:hypothetical protein
LTSIVRCRTRLRARRSINTDDVRRSLTGTSRIEGRVTASQIASASAAMPQPSSASAASLIAARRSALTMLADVALALEYGATCQLA